MGVIETIRGNCDEDATGGNGFLIGGNGIFSGVGDLFQGAGIIGVAPLCSGDGVNDGGNGASRGSSTIMGGGSYCSMDEYSLRCDPQGTNGSGGVATWGSSTGSGLGGMGMNEGANGDGFTRGGDCALCIMGGSDMTSLDGDDDGVFGMVMDVPPTPEESGLGMNTGDGDLLLMALLRLLRRL